MDISILASWVVRLLATLLAVVVLLFQKLDGRLPLIGPEAEHEQLGPRQGSGTMDSGLVAHCASTGANESIFSVTACFSRKQWKFWQLVQAIAAIEVLRCLKSVM